MTIHWGPTLLGAFMVLWPFIASKLVFGTWWPFGIGR